MRTTKLLLMLVALSLLAGLIASPVVGAQSGNLLQNPNWEQGTAGGWEFWHYEKQVNLPDTKPPQPDLNESFYAPDFVPSEAKWNHTEGGSVAGAVSGKQHTKFRGGYFQTVQVPAGARVRFSVWVNEYCETSGEKGPVILKAGIDPNGNGNWQSGDIKWVGTEIANNKYVQLTTEEVTVGPNGRVTVFTWGEPRYPMLYNAAYFDDAALIVTAAAPATTPTAAAAAPPTPKPALPAQPASCATLRYVSDVTVPDDTVMAPGQQFVKTWRVRNSGTCAFSGTLNFVGRGNQMGGQSPTAMPKVDPGQQADVSINLTAPTQPGDYQGTWQPRTSNGIAMENLIIKIKVSADAPTPIPAVTATPQGQVPIPTASPTPTTGQVCVLAYDDRNGDGQQGSDENLARGVVFTLADVGGTRDSYTTDGVNEPYCFADLPPGSYQLTMKAPNNYTSTTSKLMVIALNGGMKTDVAHGVRRGGPAPTATRTGSASSSSGLGGAARVVLIIVAVLVLLGLGFGGAFLLLSRRQ